MKLTKLLSVVLVVTLLWLTGCASAKALRELPLAAEDVEKAMAAESLTWKIVETQSLREGHSHHMLENQNGKLVATINSYEADERRNVQLSLINDSKLAAQRDAENEILEGDWAKMFKIACGLYDSGKNADKLYKSFCKVIEEEEYEPKDREVIDWHKKIDGLNYVVRYRPSVKYHGKFDLLSINVMNSADYEAYLILQEEAVARNSERKKITEQEK